MSDEMILFSVYYRERLEDGTFTWTKVPLAMCTLGRNCGCAKKGKMDSCDHAFFDTPDRQVALDKAAELEKLGLRHRIDAYDDTEGDD